jgi:hypothetical protein
MLSRIDLRFAGNDLEVDLKQDAPRKEKTVS